MRTCSRCRGYSERSLCPACERDDYAAEAQRRLAREENWAKEQRYHQNHIKDVSGKLLELALEAVENPSVAKKKVKVLIKSAGFSKIEEELFSEIRENNFLADCYYTTKLGLNPTLDSIKKLRHIALAHIPEWVQDSEESVYSKKVLSLFQAYQAELKSEEKLQEEERKKGEEERKKSETNRKRQEAKQKKADKIREEKAEAEWNKIAEKEAEEYKKQAPARFVKKVLSFLFVLGFLIFLPKSCVSCMNNSFDKEQAALQEREPFVAEYRNKMNRAMRAMRFQNAEDELNWKNKIKKMEPEAALEYFDSVIRENPY